MIYIGLGANLPSRFGPPRATLRHALTQLPVIRQSSFYETPPFPPSDQPHYINAVASLDFKGTAAALLARLHQVETECGRARHIVNEARPLDLDILDFNGMVQNAMPTLPHPRVTERAFVLYPLQEIAADWIDPVTRQTIDQLIAQMPPGEINKLP